MTSGGAASISNNQVTVRLDNGGYIEQGSYRYTCESTGGCVISNGTVSSGTVVQTSVRMSGPDLVVESPSVSDSSVDAGASFTLSATVRNQGEGESAATTLRYYRSDNAAISTADTEVGSEPVDGLAAAASSDFSISLTAPSAAGTVYYGACVDSVSGESDTANNCSSAVAVTVSDAGTGSASTDRAALVTLYNAADGANWMNGTNCGSDAPISQWHGVRVDSNGRVSQLNLSGNQLSGSIPVELASLSNLETLDLGPNELSGPIPVELGQLSNLRFLYLYLNQLSGPIPVELAELSKLERLYLSGNLLSRCIPAGLQEVSDNDLSSVGLPFCGASAEPDLVVEAPSASDGSPDGGESITLSVIVRNRGGVESALTTLRYYRSSNSTISSNNTPVGTDTVNSLSAAGTSDESIELNAPTSAGTYYYGACVDPVSGETYTGNNCSSGVRVEVADDTEVGTGACRAGLVVNPGESCTYNGSTFTVSAAGRGSIAIFSGAANIDIRGSMINGVRWNFYATRNSGSNSWTIHVAD